MATEAIRTWSDWCPLVHGIEPVDGWVLHEYDEEDGDGFTTPGYFASKDGRDVFFCHCRFHFTPTQERFEFLVRHGFPSLGRIGPTTNQNIDDAIRAERAAAVTKHGLSEAQAIALQMVRARPRQLFIETAICLVALPIAVACLEVLEAIMKG